MPRFGIDKLSMFAARLLEAGGASRTEGEVVGPSLVMADAQGYASHGVMRIPFYLQMLKKGEIISGAELEILHESNSTMVADGNWGFGRVQMGDLLKLALDRVQSNGIVAATLRHSGHIGRLGEYCHEAASKGIVAWMVANTHGTAKRVAPPGGTQPRLGTNPLAFGIPAKPDPVVLDFSTSATAEGKVRVHQIAGTPCPPGWLLDADAQPSTDPNVLYNEPSGSIRPFGDRQDYKGFGLGLIVEILAGALSGGRTSREHPLNPKGNCVLLILIDPSTLGGTGHFQDEVDQLIEYVRSSKLAEGVQEITLPGDPELVRLEQAQQNGIEIDEAGWIILSELAAELGVTNPASLH